MNRMFRLAAIPMLLVLGLSATARPLHAAAVVGVLVVAPDTTVTLGDTFCLRVVTDPFPDLKAFQLIFQFDPTRIQLTGILPGDVLTASGNPYTAYVVPDYAAPADSAWYDAAMLVGSTQGPGILAFLCFQAVGEGDSPIECRRVDFRDSFNVQTLPYCSPGMVHVIGPTAAPATTWGRVKTIYR